VGVVVYLFGFYRGLAIGAVAIAKPVGTVRRNERSAAVGTGNMIIVIGLANNRTSMLLACILSYVIACGNHN
jgi:hypothetical protein